MTQAPLSGLPLGSGMLPGDPLSGLMSLFGPPAGGQGLGTSGLSGGLSGGLFGSLLQTAQGVAGQNLLGTSSAMPPELAALLQPGATTAATSQTSWADGQANPTQIVQTVSVGNSRVSLNGPAEAVQVMAQSLTLSFQQLTITGFKGGPTAQLASALTHLGLPPAEAQALATRIDSMLELLRDQLAAAEQNLDPQAQNILTAALLAGMMTTSQSQTLGLPQLSAQTVQVSILQVTVQVTSRWTQVASASDLLQHGQAAGAQGIMANASTKPTKGQAEIMLTLLPAEAMAESGADTNATEPAAPAQLILVLPDLPSTPTKPGLTLSQQAAGVAPAFRATVQALTPPTEVTGTELYRLSEATPGTATLQAFAPAPVKAPGAALLDSPLPLANGAELAQAAAGEAAALLAEQETAPTLPTETKLRLAQQAQVGPQLALAIQPLLEQGGGTIRMTLNPPELGRLEIELQVRNGQVNGAIAASDPAVVEHLARELGNLRQQLQEAGFSLGEQGLSLLLGNPGGDAQTSQDNPGQHGQSAHSDPGTGAETEPAATPAPTNPANWVAPDRLMDVRV